MVKKELIDCVIESALRQAVCDRTPRTSFAQPSVDNAMFNFRSIRLLRRVPGVRRHLDQRSSPQFTYENIHNHAESNGNSVKNTILWLPPNFRSACVDINAL